MARRVGKSAAVTPGRSPAGKKAEPAPADTPAPSVDSQRHLEDEFHGTLADQCRRMRRKGVISGTSMDVLNLVKGYLLQRAQLESETAAGADGGGLQLPDGVSLAEILSPPRPES